MARDNEPDDAVIPRIVPPDGSPDGPPDGNAQPQTAGEREGEKEQELKDLEREALQRTDPTSDDLPDRAFDRITPGV